MMEDAKFSKKYVYIMYADFKSAFNAADHRIMFKHMRQLGMPPTFVKTCEQLYWVSTTDYITPYDSTPSIDINRGTLHGDTLSPFLLTLFLEPFLRWLTIGGHGDRRGTPTTNAHRPLKTLGDLPWPRIRRRPQPRYGLSHQHDCPNPKALPLSRVDG
jgi:hypothetical protein